MYQISVCVPLHEPLCTILYTFHTCTCHHTLHLLLFLTYIPNPILFNNPPSLPLGRYLLVRHSGARARTVSFNSRGHIVTTRESLALLAEHAELASNTDWEQNSTVIIAASPRLASPRLISPTCPCSSLYHHHDSTIHEPAISRHLSPHPDDD
jgi:hypothetical protein